MLTIANFNKILKSRRVPHYAYARFNPVELFKNYRASPVTVKRNLKIGNINDRQVVRIPSSTQHKIYHSLCHMKTIKPHIIGISSEPNDYLALETASLIQYSIMNNIKNIEWKWINSDYSDNLKCFIKPNLVIIHNVVPQYERIYKIRSIIDAFPNALRLVVVAGTNAVNYFDNFLRYPLSGMINLSGGENMNNEYVTVKSDNDIQYPVFTDDIKTLLSPIVNKLKTKE